MLVDARTDGEPTGDEVGSSRANPVVIVDAGFSTTPLQPKEGSTPVAAPVAQVGSALKRTADGSVAAPKIAKRRPKGSKVLIQYWIVCTEVH